MPVFEWAIIASAAGQWEEIFCGGYKIFAFSPRRAGGRRWRASLAGTGGGDARRSTIYGSSSAELGQ